MSDPHEALIFQTPPTLRAIVELDFSELFHMLRLVDYACQNFPEGEEMTRRVRRRLAEAWAEVSQEARVRGGLNLLYHVHHNVELERAACLPDCGHTNDELAAFDQGVHDGEAMGLGATNPYTAPELREAWAQGHSVGALNKRQNKELPPC